MSNDTQTLTLTEFLLARIAEDEERFQQATVTGGTEGDAATFTRRVLAECEARRRIVNLAVDGFEHNPNSTLRILAAVYADHPDYRENWRS